MRKSGSTLLNRDENHDGWKECDEILVALVFHPPAKAANSYTRSALHAGIVVLKTDLDKLIDLYKCQATIYDDAKHHRRTGYAFRSALYMPCMRMLLSAGKTCTEGVENESIDDAQR